MSVQGEPQSLSPRQALPHEIAGFGIALSLAGLYFVLGSIGVLPMPETNSPAFMMTAAGAAFLFAGIFCFVRAGSGLKLDYPTFAIGLFGGFATIGTWIAIGSGPHTFSGAMQTTGDLVGRTVFGLGAVIVWICIIALTVGTVRKLCDRG